MFSVYILATYILPHRELAQNIANTTVGIQHLPHTQKIQWVQHDYNFRQKGYTGLSSLWKNELMHSGKITLLSFNFSSENNKISLKETL